jgi:mannan endo-1,4-beta-mannosidase
MSKGYLRTIVVSFLFTLIVVAQEHPGFYVEGRHLYDRCGEKVILRGVSNPNIWFERDGRIRFQEIEQTGANVVRIVWETKGTPDQLNSAIENCLAFKMIPMVEVHDATGNWDKLQQCVDYWTRDDVARVIIAHETYLLLNIANEAGDYHVAPEAFKSVYEAAIKQIRGAAIHVPLIIDGTDWGKNINIMQSEGPPLIESDPDHNLLFSVHMWWPQMYGFSESDIINEIDQSVNMGLPLIVGEFSQMHGNCDDREITANNSIAYKTIIKHCHLNQIGWIAWSWFGNCNPFWDMSSDGTYNKLYDWGLEVAVTDSFSIQKTSIRPYSIIHGECETIKPQSPGKVGIKENR